ncbi:MAG: aspartate aminotransferase family protein [Clostridiales bacterium]|nr:aspartate aminotransferase family protein [Clostridiales bacterium]
MANQSESGHIMEKTEQYVLHTYNRFPVVFEKGEGVYLTDVDGKQYLDFGAGIAVFALGYGNEEFNNALKEQIDKIIHTSNLFYNVSLAEAGEKLAKASGLGKVFFTNSGTEAIEGALKAARKYAYLKEQARKSATAMETLYAPLRSALNDRPLDDQRPRFASAADRVSDAKNASRFADAAVSPAIDTGKLDNASAASAQAGCAGDADDGAAAYEIIAMNHSFHGRSVGALSVTGNPHYQEAFKPLMGGVRFADFNDLESVKAQVSDRTCAIILETVQGEGGVYPAEPEFLQGVRALCDEKDILLIIDEIQCGMGRTGSWFACQQYGVQPDIMTCAKALGCGVPVGAFVLSEKVAEASLVPGDHGTTYGGNPFACAAVSKVFDLFEKLHIVEHVQALTPYFEQQLDALVEKYDFLTARRGKGFMQGIVVEGRPVGDIVKAALGNGLVVLSAEGNVLRLVPPLVIEKEDIDEMVRRLEKSFSM